MGDPAHKRGSGRRPRALRPGALPLELAADVLAGAPGVSETLARVVAAGRRALSADRATCYLLGPRGRVGMVHTTDTDPARREIIEGAVGRDMPIARIIRARASPVLTVSDAGRSRVVPRGIAERLRVGALMAVRLTQADMDAQTEVEIGWLFFSWRAPRPFAAADRRLARAFAVHAAHALSNARAREDVRRASGVGARAQRIGRMGGWEWDVEGGRVEYSPEGFGILGLEPGAPIPRSLFVELVHPDDRAAGSAVLTELMAGQRDEYEIQHRIVQAGRGDPARHQPRRGHR